MSVLPTDRARERPASGSKSTAATSTRGSRPIERRSDIHNSDRRGTANGDAAEVVSRTWVELQQLDCGSWVIWVGGAFAGEELPRPEELFGMPSGAARPAPQREAGSPGKSQIAAPQIVGPMSGRRHGRLYVVAGGAFPVVHVAEGALVPDAVCVLAAGRHWIEP